MASSGPANTVSSCWLSSLALAASQNPYSIFHIPYSLTSRRGRGARTNEQTVTTGRHSNPTTFNLQPSTFGVRSRTMNNHDPRPPSPSRRNRESPNSPSPTSFDLERIFSHPAGLRVARKVTESLIAQRPLFGTNPDVMDRLGEILILSEAYTRDRSSAHQSGKGGTMSDRHFPQNGEPSRRPGKLPLLPPHSLMDCDVHS